ISVTFDSASPFNGKMKGRNVGGLILLSIPIETDFLELFMRSYAMDVKFGDRPVASIQLEGSYAAGEEMIACQSSMDENRAPRDGRRDRDPFASPGGSRQQQDPFRQ